MDQQLTSKLIRVMSLCIAGVLVLLPFHAFLTIWLASGLGHYTLLRLWKEIVLVVVGLVAIVLLRYDHAMRSALKHERFFWLLGIYTVLLLFLGLTSLAHHQVSSKALAYGLLDDLRYILFFVLCVGIAARDTWLQKNWLRLLLMPAAVVVAFGLLQIFVLPGNFLSHFGYGPATIAPFETVNSNLHFIRAQSFLRGANPLGAYLVLVLAAIAVQLTRRQSQRVRLAYSLFGLGTVIVLYFTYSRSAWVGAAIAIAVVACQAIKNVRLKRWLLLGTACLMVLAGLGTFALRHNIRFESVVFHTSPHTVPTTSDQNHSSALKQGLHDIVHDPLGRGPGTAGPASTYNQQAPPRIAENYFVQIGQEAGWLGLALFLTIIAMLAVLLWRADREPLALALFASLLGISFVGLLSHVWSDDTLSYAWWGLAGVALAPQLIRAQKQKVKR